MLTKIQQVEQVQTCLMLQFNSVDDNTASGTGSDSLLFQNSGKKVYFFHNFKTVVEFYQMTKARKFYLLSTVRLWQL